jgi:hypothetical protein
VRKLYGAWCILPSTEAARADCAIETGASMEGTYVVRRLTQCIHLSIGSSGQRLPFQWDTARAQSFNVPEAFDATRQDLRAETQGFEPPEYY